ncbi:hypothetical protein ASPCAL04427 [Aspergillus calidoustus]|uniref:Uncharacterized protein n=1 Tax=Aspergillus calidoustus TaxID=454130 RepID=A0A0U5FX22_ASPCI|nr:hypothetical protein ASPCAL04427 [Aspergillus calidoustus]
MKFEPPSYFSSDDDDSIMSLEDKFHLEPKAKSGGILPDDDYQPNDDDSVYVSKPKPKASPLKRKLEPVITKPQPASSATYAASGLKKLKLADKPTSPKTQPGAPIAAPAVTRPVQKETPTVTVTKATAATYNDRFASSSDESSPSPTSRRMRKKDVRDDDRNYVASNSDDEDGENAADEAYHIPGAERATVMFDFDRERERRMAGAVKLPKNLYTQKEKTLFLQLAMRGFEPLAPKHWQFDFPTLPDSLFPEPGKERAEPIIKISRSTTFHAIKSLANLFSLSGRVRDCSIVEKRPERLIKDTIKRYIRWALYDANLEIGPGSLPVHVVHAQGKNESILHALERVNKSLQRLALRHQKALNEAFTIIEKPKKDEPANPKTISKKELPLLVGFIICGPVVAIMTFDLDLLKRAQPADGKFISQFDLAERGQDVWNSLSMTIAVMHIRNTMVRLSEKGYGGYVNTAKRGAVDKDL